MLNQLTGFMTSLMLLTSSLSFNRAQNQSPEIIHLYTSKKVYQVGETIDIEYFYANEKNEKIEEKWTYKREDEDDKDVLYTKPEALFTTGNYIVRLRLQDEKGHLSQMQECLIKVRGKSCKTEYESKFGKVPIGTTIDNFERTNYRAFKTLEASQIIDKEGSLIMSNSPESVMEEGILYEDTVEGWGRLLIHHINQMKEDGKRLVVIAENRGKRQIELNLINSVFKGPSKDILFTGQQALYAYFKANSRDYLHLDKDKQYIIYDSKESGWQYDEAISGMVDFKSDGPITYTVAAFSDDKELEEIKCLPYLARDRHPRGTFNTLEKYYTLEADNLGENVKIILGDKEEEWVQGEDTLIKEKSINKGNFGVIYKLNLTVKEDTAVILNPRGDMFKGAIKWNGIGSYMVPKYGYFPSLNRASYLGVIKGGEAKELIYMLPCGSSAPIVIGLIPRWNWGT